MKNRNSENLKVLKRIVGHDLYMEIVKEFGGGPPIYINDWGKGFTSKKDRDGSIRSDYYQQGLSVDDIAEKYDLTKSTVYKIIEHR